MVWNTIGIVAAIIYFAFNILTAKVLSTREMKREFIDGQCFIGKFFANIFYLPAWVLKATRFAVVFLIK